MESKNSPVSWHNVFPSGGSKKYQTRRYIAMEFKGKHIWNIFLTTNVVGDLKDPKAIHKQILPHIRATTDAVPSLWAFQQASTSLQRDFHGSVLNILKISIPGLSYRSQASSFQRNITIGVDSKCTDVKHVDENICNGPVAAGYSYRIQLRLYEKGMCVSVCVCVWCVPYWD